MRNDVLTRENAAKVARIKQINRDPIECVNSRRNGLRTIEIAASAAVLIVDDSIKRRNWFLSSYRIPQAHVAHTSEGAIETIRRFGPDFTFLDFDLCPATATDSRPVAEYLRDANYAGKVFITSANPFGVECIRRILPQAQVARFGEFEILRCAPSVRPFLRT